MGGCCQANDDVQFELKTDSYGINENRHCTDVIFLLLFIGAGIGMLAVAAQAFEKGEPARLYYGTDYLGKTCGHGSPPGPLTTDWSDRLNIWLPNFADTKFGICVAQCPTKYGDFITTYPDTSPKVFYPTYPTKETLHRCVPTSEAIANQSAAENAKKELEDGEFFRQGFGELGFSWRVILTSCFIACLLCFLWIMLLRYTVVFMVWLTLILLFAILLTSACVVWFTLATDEDTNNQDAWKGLAITLFVLTAIYLILLLWFIRRIKIAIEIIKESTKAFASIHGIFVLPTLLFVAMAMVSLWHLYVAVYLESAGKIDDSQSTGTETGGVNFTGPFNVFASDKSLQYAQIYNLFMFFWTTAYLEALEYATIGGAVIGWYFSNAGEEKTAPNMAVLSSFKRAFFYHSGSLFLGSLLIALVKTVRFLLERFRGKMQKIDEGDGSRCVRCCCHCCFAYLQKIIEFISKYAYIMVAMHGTSFCSSARHVLALIVENAFKVAILNFISDLVLFLSKILITFVVLLIARAQLADGHMAPGVDSQLFPLVFIGLITFVICTLWMRVFDTCIDTVLLCFMEDRHANDGSSRPYYMPKSLSELVEK